MARSLFVLIASALLAGGCGDERPEPLVVLIGLDGATPSVIDELRAAGELENFERLARRGAHGPLQSLASRRVLRESTRHGFFSPIVWTSIATGQVPEDHGVRDFVMPIEGTSSVWMGAGESPRASLRLPELSGRAPFTVHLRLHSHGDVGEQDVQVVANGEGLGSLRVGTDWNDFELQLPGSALRPAQNELEFVYSRRSAPGSTDPRPLALELGRLRIADARGATSVVFDPVLDRFSLGPGFHVPTARTTEVQSVHWRAKPIWMLLGDVELPAGIIGFWGTWPAYPLDGFLVSSRMGIAEQRRGSDRLTWPPELAERLESLAPGADERDALFERLHVSGCEPRFVDQKSVLKKILIQDELYARVAEELLPAIHRGFASVYFRSIDVASHVALQYRHGAPIPDGCPDSLRRVVDAVYAQVDRWIARVLDVLPPHATVVVVSDHGMAPLDMAGGHAPEGVLFASGTGIRRGARVRGATVLDIAPTILHLLGAPIPLDMDGKLLVQLFEPRALEERPPVYRNIDTALEPGASSESEVTDEVLDELRSLGYIQ